MPLLFSYGTLQQEDVQLSTFGRRLTGQKDALPKFEAAFFYKRASVTLESGKQAWVYVDAQTATA